MTATIRYRSPAMADALEAFGVDPRQAEVEIGVSWRSIDASVGASLEATQARELAEALAALGIEVTLTLEHVEATTETVGPGRGPT